MQRKNVGSLELGSTTLLRVENEIGSSSFFPSQLGLCYIVHAALNIAVCLAQHVLIQLLCCPVGKALQTWLGALLCVKLLPYAVQNSDRIWKLGRCGLSIASPSLLAFSGLSRSFMLVTLSSHCCSKGSGVNSWYMNWPSALNCLE